MHRGIFLESYFLLQHTKILLFHMENYTIRMDVIGCYLLLNSIELKLFNQKYEYIALKKISKHLMQFHFGLQKYGNFIFKEFQSSRVS